MMFAHFLPGIYRYRATAQRKKKIFMLLWQATACGPLPFAVSGNRSLCGRRSGRTGGRTRRAREEEETWTRFLPFFLECHPRSLSSSNACHAMMAKKIAMLNLSLMSYTLWLKSQTTYSLITHKWQILYEFPTKLFDFVKIRLNLLGWSKTVSSGLTHWSGRVITHINVKFSQRFKLSKIFRE